VCDCNLDPLWFATWHVVWMKSGSFVGCNMACEFAKTKMVLIVCNMACVFATSILCGLQIDMSVCKKIMVCTYVLLWLQHGRVCDCYLRDCGLQPEKRCVLATSAVSVWFAPWTDAWLQLLVSRDCNMEKTLIYCIRFATYTARRLQIWKRTDREVATSVWIECDLSVLYCSMLLCKLKTKKSLWLQLHKPINCDAHKKPL
jgi:hypothetical protein